MATTEKIWMLEQQKEQILAAKEDVRKALVAVEQEHSSRVTDNSAKLKAVNKFELLKAQLLQQEVDIAQEMLIAEKAAQEEQTKTSDGLREKMRELQERIDALPTRRDDVEKRIFDTREELIALHKEILDDQPGIDKGIKLMESFKGSARSSSEESEDRVEFIKSVDVDAREEGEKSVGRESVAAIEIEAEELGLTIEELEAFHLANEEFESMAYNLYQKEKDTKEKLLVASKDSERVQEDLAERARVMEAVTTSIEILSNQAKNVEANIIKSENRQANLMAKNNDEELRAALDETKKLDRLLEALTKKATAQEPSTEATPATM